jgi:hypothetical protein
MFCEWNTELPERVRELAVELSNAVNQPKTVPINFLEKNNMTLTTKIVRGKYFDGCTSDDAGYVAEKINDIADAAAAITSISTCKQGDLLVATIVYTAAA